MASLTDAISGITGEDTRLEEITMAYPYGEVSQSLQNLGQTFERLGGRQMQHKEEMAKLGLQGEQLKGQQAMDKAKFEYEQWLNTPMSVRDAILTSPNLARKPEVQKNMLALVEQPHEGLGGKKIGDVMASPGMLNQVLGEWRQSQISDKTRKDTQAFEEGMFGKKTAFEKEMFKERSKDEWNRLQSSQGHAENMARSRRIYELATQRQTPEWRQALSPSGELGYKDIKHPEVFVPTGFKAGEYGPDGNPIKGGAGGRGGRGGASGKGGIDYTKDPFYKKLSEETIRLNTENSIGGTPDPLDPTKIVEFTPEEKGRRDKLLKDNYDNLYAFWYGYGNDPAGWQNVKSEILSKERERVSKDVDELVKQSKDRSLEEIEQMKYSLQQDDPVAAEMFQEKIRPVTEEKYKQQVNLAKIHRQANALPGNYNWFDKILNRLENIGPTGSERLKYQKGVQEGIIADGEDITYEEAVARAKSEEVAKRRGSLGEQPLPSPVPADIRAMARERLRKATTGRRDR